MISIFDADCEILIHAVIGDVVHASFDGKNYAITMHRDTPKPNPGDVAFYSPFNRASNVSLLDGYPCVYTACISY